MAREFRGCWWWRTLPTIPRGGGDPEDGAPGLSQAAPGGGVESRTNTSRRKIFQEPYARAFNDADLILVREPPDLWKVEPEDSSPPGSWWRTCGRRPGSPLFPRHRSAPDGLLNTLRPGDVVLVMSNGDFNHLVPRLCEALEARAQDRQLLPDLAHVPCRHRQSYLCPGGLWRLGQLVPASSGRP